MTDDVRAVGQRMYEAFNAHDFGAAETIFAPDFVSHPLGTTGAESVVWAWTRFHERFPDVRVIIEDMLVDGDKVAVRTTLHGLPADVVEQQPPPTMLEIFRVRDGRIAELWGLSALR
ncbi:nuclear transport factor 2 family protein [Nonomuraea sp. NPDC052129]|uniref:ester cyclase n=1 Tax=Nonomuraea sp. NPDC052129 TaxID=3154651 RepID=UPI003421D7D2